MLKKEGLDEIVLNLDKSKIHRVLVNLVSNAVKYTPKGSVTVSYKLSGDMIEIRIPAIKQRGHTTVFDVTNDLLILCRAEF